MIVLSFLATEFLKRCNFLPQVSGFWSCRRPQRVLHQLLHRVLLQARKLRTRPPGHPTSGVSPTHLLTPPRLDQRRGFTAPAPAAPGSGSGPTLSTRQSSLPTRRGQGLKLNKDLEDIAFPYFYVLSWLFSLVVGLGGGRSNSRDKSSK